MPASATLSLYFIDLKFGLSDTVRTSICAVVKEMADCFLPPVWNK